MDFLEILNSLNRSKSVYECWFEFYIHFFGIHVTILVPFTYDQL